MTSVYGPSCDRTRALLSRQLDAQLSELDRRTVALHTARCAGCRAFDAECRWITAELRAAPLAPLPRAVSVTLPRRRFPTRVVANFASAAALLVVAVTGVTAVTNVPERSGLSDQAVAIDTGFEDPLVHELRREWLRTGDLQILPADTSTGVKPPLP